MPNIRHAIMWNYEVWSELDAHIIRNCWRITHILSATWNVDFGLVDKREENRMQEESNKLDALISKLRLDDEEMLKRDLHSDGRRRDYRARIEY